MAIKLYKPTTPGRRHASVVDTSHLDKKRPERTLRFMIKKTGGRNNQGKISVRHKGGGAKRFYRVIDFKRDKYDVLGRVIALEYDPNRTAHIALIQYPDGEKRYILAPEGLCKDQKVISSRKETVPIEPGNTIPLKLIPPGIPVHNIELEPRKGGALVRSAGLAAIVQVVESGYAQLKLPSGELRRVKEGCAGTIGTVSNASSRNVRLGKAGRMRHLGVRPTVTGKSMNPVDHPHGGGEGHQPIGLKGPKTKWGKPALGVKTRRKKWSDKLILQRRGKKK
ncbi:MAG: 50S ribosomal protein L2 [Candidatus Jacksonbacteria bacterium]|nr:50S ribosomal protein L2 [Candidatus Jacksonbacteria bacterium]